MGFIDADSHVLETKETWSYLDPSEEVYRPQIVEFEPGVAAKLGARASNEAPPRTVSRLWLAGDTWTRTAPPHGAMSPHVNAFDPSVLDMTNPSGRIEALDALGIDAELIFSTFFIGTEIDHPLEEAALARSYNRWMAERLAGYTDRLLWAARPPIRMMDRGIEELHFAKEHGAVGIHLRGVEHGMFLCDPYLFPLYEVAQELDLAVLVHNGSSTRRNEATQIGNFVPHPPALLNQLIALMCAFHAVIGSDLPQRFPRLKWGFHEGGAAFTIPVIQQHARRDMSIGVRSFLDPKWLSPEQIEAMNVFVAIETDEDIPYLASLLGEGALIVGTDFGHNDLGAELGAHSTVLARPDVPSSLAQRIVDTNSRRLLNLKPDWNPAPPGRLHDLPHVEAVAGGEAIVVPPWLQPRGELVP